MTLAAIAGVLAGQPDGGALPRRPARAGDRAAPPGAGAAPRGRHPARARTRRRASPRRCRRRRSAASARRTRRSRTRSSSRTATTPRSSPTRAAARASAAGAPSPGGARTRPATRGASSSTCATSAAGGSGRRPTTRPASEAEDDVVDVHDGEGDLPAEGRRDRDAARRRRLARGRRRGAPARGDEPRRSRPRARGHELRRDRPGADRRRPRPPRLRQALRRVRVRRREQRAALPAAAARPGRRRASSRVHVISQEGRTQGPVEWESDRGALPRPRARPRGSAGARRALALRHDRRPARSHRQPAAARPARARAAWCGSPSPPGWRRAGRRPWRSRSATTTRAPPRGPSRSPSRTRGARLRHLGISSEEALLFERLASRVLYADASLRAGPGAPGPEHARPGGALGARHLRRPPHPARARRRRRPTSPLVRQVLQAQEYWRLKGLSADVVILNEHPVSYLDEVHAAARRRSSTTGRGGPGSTGRAAPTSCAGDRMAEAERLLLCGVARAVLSGDRGSLAQQLDRPAPPVARARAARAGAAAPARPGARAGRPARGAAARARRTGSAASPTAGGSTSSSSRATEETPLPWVNVIANPAFGTIVTASGLGLHLVREQPREPAHAVRQRPGHRSDRRGHPRPRRRHAARRGRPRRGRCPATARAAGS